MFTFYCQTGSLTTGTETVTGTANNDTINGVTSTLTSAKTFDTTDIIDGGAGTDTMNITMNSSFTGMTGTGAVSNVENIAITNASTVARTFDATGITGVTAYTIDATNAGVSLSDMAATASVALSNQASGSFSTAFATGAAELTATTDAMTFTVNNVGTADNAATASTNEEAAVTVTLNDIETVNVDATGTNVLDFDGSASDLKTINVAGAGDVKITKVEASVTTVDASESTGDITLDVTDATSVTTFATGSGDDTVTFDETKAVANITMSGGDGTDTLNLESNGGTVQYGMSGFETLALNGVTTAQLNFSGTNVSGITTVSTVAANTAKTSLVNMGAGDLTINAKGATGDGGDLDSTHTGATTLNFTADAASVTAKTVQESAADFNFTGTSDLTVNVGAYISTTGNTIQADNATSVTLNVASGKDSASTPVEITDFDGALTAADATSFTADIQGKITATGAITLASALDATITNSTTAGAMNLQATELETLTLTSGNTFDMTGSDLSDVQVATITVDKGTYTGVNMVAIANLTVAGAGTTAGSLSTASFGNLGGDNAYSMTVNASGLKGGFSAGTVNVGAGYDVTVNASDVTGDVTLTSINQTTVGKNVTLTTTGTGGDVSVGAVNATGDITVTNSSTGTFGLGAVSTTLGNVTVDLDGTADAVTLSTFSGVNVNVDVSDTIGGVTWAGSDITAKTSVTLAVSELQNNTVAIATATTSTAFTAALTGGIGNDAITITGAAAQESITVTGNLDIGTNTLGVTLADSSAATTTVSLAGFTSSGTNTIDVTTEADDNVTVTGSADTDDTDVLVINDAQDYTATGATLTFTGIETLSIETGTTATIWASNISGKEMTVKGADADNDVLTVKAATTGGTIDLSDITLDTATGIRVTGSAVVDTITGTTGADVINGGAGADEMTGNGGVDTYVYSAKTEGADTITDFGTTDVIMFTADDIAADGYASLFDTNGTNDAGDVVFANTDPTNTAGTIVALNAFDYNEITVTGTVADNKVNIITTAAGYASVTAALNTIDDDGTGDVGDSMSLIFGFWNSADSEFQLHYVTDTGTAAAEFADAVSVELVGLSNITSTGIAALGEGNFSVISLG